MTFSRPLKNAPAYRQAGICGVALILPRVKHGAGLLRRTSEYASSRLTNSPAWQEVAPYSSRRHSQDCLPDRQVKSTAGALHLGIFEQSEKNDFFSKLLGNSRIPPHFFA
jgi:hypothetical protein